MFPGFFSNYGVTCTTPHPRTVAWAASQTIESKSGTESGECGETRTVGNRTELGQIAKRSKFCKNTFSGAQENVLIGHTSGLIILKKKRAGEITERM